MSKVYHYLASANTGNGFVDNFDYILNKNLNHFCFILKGGSGTGKSTLLKKVGKNFENANYDVEYFHCSSDFNSLDGVRIIDLNVSIIDGTAPHTKDSILPSVYDKIVNLGDYIDFKVSAHKKKILNLVELKKQQYDTIYNYLNICNKLEEITFNENIKDFNIDNYNQIYKQILIKLNLKQQKTNANIRKLFIHYIGDNGIENAINLNNYKQVITINEDNYTNYKILNQLQNEINNFGYSTIQFYDIISNKITAIYVEKLRILILSNNTNKHNKNIINFNEKIKNNVLHKVSNALNKAKKHHKEIEKIYIENVDFEGINELTSKLILDILKLRNIK
ncbi:MAG: hypothetical protein ACI4TX_01885 [Christensenellales bacterium]